MTEVRRYHRRTLQIKDTFYDHIIPRKAGSEVSFLYPKNISHIPNHDSQDSRINMIQFGRGSHGNSNSHSYGRQGWWPYECKVEGRYKKSRSRMNGFKDFMAKPTSRSLDRGILSSVKSVIKSFYESTSSFSR